LERNSFGKRTPYPQRNRTYVQSSRATLAPALSEASAPLFTSALNDNLSDDGGTYDAPVPDTTPEVSGLAPLSLSLMSEVFSMYWNFRSGEKNQDTFTNQYHKDNSFFFLGRGF